MSGTVRYDVGPHLLVEADGPVRVVRLNRPEQLNATNHELHQGLAALFPQLDADAGARAVVLTGNGRAFSAGGDFTYLDELTKDDLVLRYRVEGTDTGFSGEEGTFTICSFWLVSALALIGETDRARALCQKLLSFAGPLLLYAEEIDPATGEHLGNFPQAFTHLALVEAVSLLIASELAEEVRSAGWDPAAGTQVRSG